jgi:hypothetical protein
MLNLSCDAFVNKVGNLGRILVSSDPSENCHYIYHIPMPIKFMCAYAHGQILLSTSKHWYRHPVRSVTGFA